MKKALVGTKPLENLIRRDSISIIIHLLEFVNIIGDIYKILVFLFIK